MEPSRKNQSDVRSVLRAGPRVSEQTGSSDESGGYYLDTKDPDRPRILVLSVWKWLLILMLAFGVQSASAQATIWSMGYYWPPNGYPTIADVDWDALTHIAIVGGQVNADGTLTPVPTAFTDKAAAAIAAAHAHGVLALYSISSSGGTNFASAITNNEGALIANIMSTVNTYGFDGVDVDDEETWNGTAMTTLLSDLRINLGSKLLSFAALSDTYIHWNSTYTSYVDRVSLMSYDWSGPWDPYTWFNSPLNSWNNFSAISKLIPLFESSGVPAEKLNIGLAFYGNLVTPNTGPYQTWGASPSVTQVSYSDIINTYNISGATYDSTAHVPWIAGGGGYLNWDNPQSITGKVNYAKANGLGGWIIWSLGRDYVPGATPNGPLLDAVKQAFRPPPPRNLNITVQ